MQFKVLASTAALAAAMMFAGPAAAQTSINGTVIPEAELPLVQEHCNNLQTAGDTVSESANESAGDGVVENAGDNEASDDAAPADAMAQAETPTIDLTTIDLQACVDAGLVTQ
jgi:hypothetical protein